MFSKRLLLLLLLLLAMSGCSIGPGASKGSIGFREIFESRRGDELRIERTVELDVDADGEDEWLVLYRYDPTLQQEWENTPIQGIVYDARACDPPTIQEWRLPFPDNDYLGEGEDIRASLQDWLANSGPNEVTQELIINGPGPVNTLSIYRFHDYLLDPCKPADESKQGFTLLGYFQANGDIIWDAETRTITTYQRGSYDRSQLAIRSLYAPRQSNIGETFIEPNGRMMSPNEQSVDFLYGFPRSPTDSPYPEKAVAAFYLALGQDNDRARSYLSDELASGFSQESWGLGLTPDRVSKVLIYSISYTPNREAELAHRDREVTVVVAPVDTNNQRLAPRRITWRLKGIAIDGRKDCEWRLAEISTVVTEGLGFNTLDPMMELLAVGP